MNFTFSYDRTEGALIKNRR